MDMKLKLSEKYNYVKSGGDDKYIFEKHGGEVFFELNEKIPQDCKYFAFDIENVQDFSVRIEIHFYRRKVSEPAEWFMESPDFSIPKDVPPIVKTTVEIPLSCLDGRVNLSDIAYAGIYMTRCDVKPTLGISNARFTSDST